MVKQKEDMQTLYKALLLNLQKVTGTVLELLFN